MSPALGGPWSLRKLGGLILPRAIPAILLTALALSSRYSYCSEAPRIRTGIQEPPALSFLVDLRPALRDLASGRVLDTEWEFGLDVRPPGILRCSVRVPLTIRIGLEGAWTGRSEAAWGDPAVEAGAFFRRDGGFWFLGVGYAAPLGRVSADPDRPFLPVPGSGFHRATVSTGWGRIRDPAALGAGFSWTVSIPRSGMPEPFWRPGDLALSLSMVEVLNDRTGLLLGLSPRLRAPPRGPGAGPDAGFDWDLEARIEVHLRSGRAFIRTGTARSLTDSREPYRTSAGFEYEVKFPSEVEP